MTHLTLVLHYHRNHSINFHCKSIDRVLCEQSSLISNVLMQENKGISFNIMTSFLFRTFYTFLFYPKNEFGQHFFLILQLKLTVSLQFCVENKQILICYINGLPWKIYFVLFIIIVNINKGVKTKKIFPQRFFYENLFQL